MIPGIRRDPLLAFNFHVMIEGVGILIGGFTEVSGLQVETVVETYREGGVNDYEHKFMGPTRYPSNLILKHGLTDVDFLMWLWHNDIRQNNIHRSNGTILLLNSFGLPRAGWRVEGLCPVKWNGPDLNANVSTVAFESIELVHRGITRFSP